MRLTKLQKEFLGIFGAVATIFTLLAIAAHADIAVTQGSGKTVATQTINSREYQGVVLIDPTGVSSGTIVADQSFVVSSTTLPSQKTDASTGTAIMDSFGRAIVADIPVTVISATSSINAAANAVEYILISSATAGQRTYLCGFSAMNSSTTATGFVLYQSTSATTVPTFYPIGASSNFVASGIRTDCGHPFFWSVPGGEITIKPTVAVTSVTVNVEYFQK